MEREHHPIGDSFNIGRAFGNAFAAIRVATGPMWLGGLLLWISDGCSAPTQFPDPSEAGDDDAQAAWSQLTQGMLAWPRVAIAFGTSFAELEGREILAFVIGIVVAMAIAVMVVGLLLFALGCWAQTGFIRMHVHILEHASNRLDPLFSGRDRFRAVAGYKLLSGLALAATACAAAWPGLLLAYYGQERDSTTLVTAGLGLGTILGVPALVYVALGLFLGDCAVVIERASPVHALRRAWALARGNRLPLLAFGVVSVLIQIASMVGLVLCCVGVLATAPLGRALVGFAKTESFLLFTRGYGEAAKWRLWQRQAADSRHEHEREALESPQGPLDSA